MDNPNSKISDEIKKKIKEETVSDIEKELKKNLESGLSKKVGGEVSKLDPKVKEEVDNLVKDSKPISQNNNSQKEAKENGLADDLSRDKKNSSLPKQNKTIPNVVKPLPTDMNMQNEEKTESENEGEGDEKEKKEKSTSEENTVDKEDGSAKDLNSQKNIDAKDSTDKKADTNTETTETSNKAKDLFKKLLKQSILSAVETFGFSLFYSYFHLFMNMVLPKFFCAPGEEMVPEEIQKSDPKEAEIVGKRIGVFEHPALCCACILHMFLIVCAITVIYIIIFPRAFAWQWLIGVFSD